MKVVVFLSSSTLYACILDLAKGKETSRINIAKKLLSSPVEERKAAINQGLHAKDFKVRRATFALIGEMQDNTFVDHIVTGLQDKHADVIQMAVWAMGKLKWKQGLPALLELLNKGYGFKVTKTIVWTIGEIGYQTAVDDLKQLLQEASTRLTEGILVSGIKLGHSAFLRLIPSLNCTRESVQAALKDASSSSGKIRGAFIRAVVRTKDSHLLSCILDALPYVTFYDADYKRLAEDARENVRLAVCHSIANSLLPKSSKLSYLIRFLDDASNAVVRASLQHLSSYSRDERVSKSIECLTESHPSPKIRDLAEAVLEREKILRQVQTAVPKWGRCILETLPGLESFVEQEATLRGVVLHKGAAGNGYLEVFQEASDIEKLRSLHTVRQVYGIVSYFDETEKANIVTNPYIHAHQLDQLIPHGKEIKIQSMTFQTIPVVTEKEMRRPARRLRSTSLDWRVARAMVLCSNPSSDDIVVDPTCGSGTILLDRAAFGTYQALKGGDLDEEAVRAATENLEGYKNVAIQKWNATALPFANNSVNAVISNLPFGRRVGDHEANVALYSPFVKEVYRILNDGGRAVLLTQEIKLLYQAITKNKTSFLVELDQPIEMGGLTPHIIVLRARKQ